LIVAAARCSTACQQRAAFFFSAHDTLANSAQRHFAHASLKMYNLVACSLESTTQTRCAQNFMDNLLTYFPTLDELSRKAGAIAKRYYYAPTQFEVERKADDSPVTKADREIEEFLSTELSKRFPDYSIYGEEYGSTTKSGSYRWIIDPIDGTKSFVMRTPLFGTMIALERDGELILGSIYLPIQDQLLIGSVETGTFLNGEPVQVSQTSSLREATVILTEPRTLLSSEAVATVCQQARLVRAHGDCYGYFLVATGRADVMIEPGALAYYDVAPMPPILRGAGGVFSTLKGDLDFTTGQGLAANPKLHTEIVNLLNPTS
jgi:histidinol-phosphatase